MVITRHEVVPQNVRRIGTSIVHPLWTKRYQRQDIAKERILKWSIAGH